MSYSVVHHFTVPHLWTLFSRTKMDTLLFISFFKINWDLNLYQSALFSIHIWVTKEELWFYIIVFKWRAGIHFAQNTTFFLPFSNLRVNSMRYEDMLKTYFFGIEEMLNCPKMIWLQQDGVTSNQFGHSVFKTKIYCSLHCKAHCILIAALKPWPNFMWFFSLASYRLIVFRILWVFCEYFHETRHEVRNTHCILSYFI